MNASTPELEQWLQHRMGKAPVALPSGIGDIAFCYMKLWSFTGQVVCSFDPAEEPLVIYALDGSPRRSQLV